MDQSLDNTSGQGKHAQVPGEIDRWNWGAFLLNWIWGLGNDTYVALLMFVPGVNVVMPFWLGAKGSAWAWRNRPWRDIEHFRGVQRRWAIWGAVVWLATIGLVAAITVPLMLLFQHSQPYLMAVEQLKRHPEAVGALGTPISAGFPTGHISVENDSGSAELSFSATGPKASGTVHADASKDLGTWRLTRLKLELDDGDQTIDLLGGSTRLAPLKLPNLD